MAATPAPPPSSKGGAICGYCDRSLTLQPAGDWACAHCRPLLAHVANETEWIFFRTRVRRCAPRCRCHARQDGQAA